MRKDALISLFCLTLFALTGCMGSNSQQSMENKPATLGGGCFWCTEAVFELVKGVDAVVSGYSGGATLNPTYEDICTGRTGHAEVIKITYDPAIVSYEKLLEIFGICHDPTTLNRQGADSGTQYRSVIMYHDTEQKAAAEKWKVAVAADHADPIVTEIVEAPIFYRAEEGHQDYYRRNPNAGYCNFVIRPKLDKVKKAQEKE